MAQEVKRPTNPPANTRPTEGYVLTIDGKLKTRYETEKDAAAEAAKLKERFPVIQISVYDAAKDVHIPVGSTEAAAAAPAAVPTES